MPCLHLQVQAVRGSGLLDPEGKALGSLETSLTSYKTCMLLTHTLETLMTIARQETRGLL